MKIATWNLQRLEKRKDLGILEKINALDAGIWVFTETNQKINLGGEYDMRSSEELVQGQDGIAYKPGECRVRIFSKFPVLRVLPTADSFTSTCVELDTPIGNLLVYGTIIGIFGGKREPFKQQLAEQIEDWKMLAASGNLCVAGDFNTTFSGRAYPSHETRNKLNTVFQELSMVNHTKDCVDFVDHLVLSNSLFTAALSKIETWNSEKLLSDHEGAMITFLY